MPNEDDDVAACLTYFLRILILFVLIGCCVALNDIERAIRYR